MTIVAQPARISAFAVFRNRSFTLLWTAQLISVAGSALSSLAAAILIYRLTGSVLSVSLMLMVAALPSLFIGLFAGVAVDRLNRKQLMIAADLLRAALIGGIPFALMFGTPWLYVIMLLASAVGQFFDPAHASVLPEIAPDQELAAANSLMAISGQGAWALGFAAAGLIISVCPIEWAFGIDALSFLISAACITLVHISRSPADDSGNITTVLRDLRAGVGLVASTPVLRSLFLICIPIFGGIGLTNALLLPFSLRALGATDFQYSLLEGLCSVGFVAGSLLMARLADRLHEGQWIAISTIGFALLYVFFSLSASVPLAIALMMVGGVLNAPSVIGRQLLIQRNTPNAARGRVFSAFFVARDLLYAIGMAAAGLADLVDIRTLFLATSILLLAAGALVLVLPGLRHSAAEWRRGMQLLRGAQDRPALEPGRPMTEFDLAALAHHLPLLLGLGRAERQALLAEARIHELPADAAIMRVGERSTDAFFLIGGRAIAGVETAGSYHTLEVLHAGDLFGEIGALTGMPRTANVITTQASTVIQLPALALRRLLADPRMQRYCLSRMTERMLRTDLIDLPHHGMHRYPALRVPAALT